MFSIGYQIVYVFQGAGVTGRHGVLVASSIQVCMLSFSIQDYIYVAVQYVLNVAMTVPAIIWIGMLFYSTLRGFPNISQINGADDP